MKKTILSIAVAAVAMTVMASCGSKADNAEGTDAGATTEATTDSPAAQLLAGVDYTPEGLASMIKTPVTQPLTADEYEAVYLAYGKEQIDEKELDLKDSPTLKAIKDILKAYKKPANAKDIIAKLLNNPSPQVRGMAVTQFNSFFGVSDKNAANILSALGNEQNPFVLKNAIRTLANELKNADVAKFVLGQAKSDNPKVRTQVAYAVGNSWSKGVDGVKETATELLADGDEDVRKAMLGHVGKLADDSFVPELVKVLNDESQYKLHSEAMRSLYAMWYDYPFHKNSSKAAYDATVNYLSKKPRTQNVPAWNSVGELRSRSDKNIDAWKAASPYYSDAAYIKLMQDIAADADMNWLGRTAALDVIAKIGTKADLEKAKSAIEALSGDKNQKMVLNSLERKLNEK